MIDVLGPEKRRRRTTQEKIAIVQQSFEPGMTVSLVARQHGVAASQLFLWRKQYQEGSLTAVTAVRLPSWYCSFVSGLPAEMFFKCIIVKYSPRYTTSH
ncbi:insertion sequence 2 OrfA protein [Shigella sonnei]|nr:insertion sequence 2 OrfA protein [Shigella sonnei]